jgi:Ni,Fe-hydrogenase III component G
MTLIRDDEQLDGKFLVQMCSVDMISRIDVVYHFASLAQNHIFEVKVAADHEQPSVASISPLWSGAILQEREIYDLMGVKFPGHPELTRLFLWESFPGHARRAQVGVKPVPKAGGRPDGPGIPAEGAWHGRVAVQRRRLEVTRRIRW